MLKGLKKTGVVVLFLLVAFLFLTTLRESLGQIEVLPGNPASPVENLDDQGQDEDQDQDSEKDKAEDLLEKELKRLELALTKPLIFYLLPTLQEEGFVFDTKE